MPIADDVAMTRALERCQPPDNGLPHAAHLRVAGVYLAEAPSVDEALARMADTLRRFSAAVGQSEKYSDAITAFWMYQLAALRALMPGAELDDVLRAHPRLLDKTFYAAATDPTHPPRDASDRPLSRPPA
jgi:hypothetical protein